ncbi:MAG: radical SAM protein [Desulfotalea sp.]
MSFIIPIFIPHRGCPHQCLFCNQKSITGVTEPQSDFRQKAIETIEEWLQREEHGKKRSVEVAFYGGSFTCLSLDEQESLLSIVTSFRQAGRVNTIRLSTRPDCVDENTGHFLKRFGVTTVELGVQSMDDQVLRMAERGHDSLACTRATKFLKDSGIKVGIQLMAGLPTETTKKFLYSVKQIIGLKPDFVRLYPVVVVRYSSLEDLYLAGSYQPLSLNKAVALAVMFKKRIDKAGIKIIRMGLQASKDLEKMLVAGPYHPSFGELVQSRIWLSRIRTELQKLGAGEELYLHISPRDLSVVQGMRKNNISRLADLGYTERFHIVRDDSLERGQALFQNKKNLEQ